MDISVNFPPLTQSVMPDARLFADRKDLIRSLDNRAIEDIAEIGVALGEFSSFLIESIAPRSFVAFDIYEMHLWPEHWGSSSQDIFGDLTHRQFVENRLKAIFPKAVIEEGDSTKMLRQWPADSFDLIYVDARHDYENVKADTYEAARILRNGGYLVFNDYTIFDPFLNTPYGVVACVNELVDEGGWEVIGLALQRHMFCDIALRKL